MSKEEIKPQLFEIKCEYWSCYVVAYDMVHALQSLPANENAKEAVSIIQLTGSGRGMMNILRVAKECLPQGLVNKEDPQIEHYYKTTLNNVLSDDA